MEQYQLLEDIKMELDSVGPSLLPTLKPNTNYFPIDFTKETYDPINLLHPGDPNDAWMRAESYKAIYEEKLLLSKIKYATVEDVVFARREKIIPHLPANIYIKKLYEAKLPDGSPLRFKNPIPYAQWLYTRDDLRRQVIACYQGDGTFVGIAYTPTAMIQLWNTKKCIHAEHWAYLEQTRKGPLTDFVSDEGIYKPEKDDRMFRGWKTCVVHIDGSDILWEDLIPCYLREPSRADNLPDYINDQLPMNLKVRRSDKKELETAMVLSGMDQTTPQVVVNLAPYLVNIHSQEEYNKLKRYELFERIREMTPNELMALEGIVNTIIYQRQTLEFQAKLTNPLQ